MSVRPMRPPAPTMTTRKSESAAAIVLPYVCLAAVYRGGIRPATPESAAHPLKPRAVVTLSHDDISLSLAVAQFLRCLVFGRTVAGERGLKAWKLEHHDAIARPALHHVATAAANQIACAKFAERRLV